MSDDHKPIIIGKQEVKHYLWTIILEFQTKDETLIMATDKYMPKVEQIIKLLNKLGIREVPDSREKIKVPNTRCKYMDYVSRECTHKHSDFKNCSWTIKQMCERYEQGENSVFIANQVLIQKVGAIR